MYISIKPICHACLHELEVMDTTTTDADGHPAIRYYIAPCEACMLEAVETLQSDQLAMGIDKVRDERRDG